MPLFSFCLSVRLSSAETYSVTAAEQTEMESEPEELMTRALLALLPDMGMLCRAVLSCLVCVYLS